MFAVPGWSLSADKLKPETAASAARKSAPSAPSAAGTGAAAPGPEASAPRPKKRKRPGQVTTDNVAELWERVIEKKKREPRPKPKPKGDAGDGSGGGGGGDDDAAAANPAKKAKLDKKERRREKRASGVPSSTEAGDGDDKAAAPLSEVPGASPARDATAPAKEKKKKHGKERDAKKDKKNGKAAGTEAESKAPPPSAPPPPPAAKLTPLQASMREKLISARFRHLNETLYTRPSAEAFRLFEDSPEMFFEYHEGFRRQVEVWPENPVDGYVREVQERGRLKDDRHRHHHRHPKEGGNGNSSGPPPLPRTNGVCTVADLGCGDARLAAALAPSARKLRVEVRSFDLQSPSPLVTRADMANLPLADGAVDVAVFCLALMGTNWLDFVEEAYRVLRWKGELWVAEIKSRFTKPGGQQGQGGRKGGPGAVVAHSVGNRRKAPAAGGPKSGKPGKSGDGNNNDDAADLAVEVDGAEDGRGETDVSAFVRALARRGFLLVGGSNGDPSAPPPPEAVDLSNKMFVKMRFVKAAPATRGKCADRGRGGDAGGGGREPAKKKKKFLDDAGGDGDEEDVAAEAGILKPCVYKLR